MQILDVLLGSQPSIFAGFVSSPLKLKGSSSPWWRSWSEAKVCGSDPDVSSLDWKGRGFTHMETFRASSCYVASCLGSNLCISTFTLGSSHPQSDGYRTFCGTEEMTRGLCRCHLMKSCQCHAGHHSGNEGRHRTGCHCFVFQAELGRPGKLSWLPVSSELTRESLGPVGPL